MRKNLAVILAVTALAFAIAPAHAGMIWIDDELSCPLPPEELDGIVLSE